MKKIYCFVATAVIAVISIYTYKHINNLSVFMEANVEALANTEAKEPITRPSFHEGMGERPQFAPGFNAFLQ